MAEDTSVVAEQTAQRATAAQLDDLTLVRAFEPVVRFTRGEYFFPVGRRSFDGALSCSTSPVITNPRSSGAVTISSSP